jgi:ubiquinone/menaquinone biosynthesis C-methylase UbiE
VTRPDRHESVGRFDRIWKDYAVRETKAARVAQHASGRERFLTALEQYVHAADPPLVAEIGCGSAIDLCLLRSRVPGVLAVGIDLSWQSLGVALDFTRELDVPLRLCQGDTFALPFRTGSFGVVFSQGVLEHFPDPRAALAEQVRVLSPDGVLVVSVPQMFTAYTVHKRRAIRMGTWPWGWEDQYSSHRLRRLGERFGLRVERIFGYQYWLSWGEPAWVLRDLVGKVERRAPVSLRGLLRPVSTAYDRAWGWLEERFGHLFLQNVVAVYRVERQVR